VRPGSGRAQDTRSPRACGSARVRSSGPGREQTPDLGARPVPPAITDGAGARVGLQDKVSGGGRQSGHARTWRLEGAAGTEGQRDRGTEGQRVHPESPGAGVLLRAARTRTHARAHRHNFEQTRPLGVPGRRVLSPA
jgi:hypothetical protein